MLLSLLKSAGTIISVPKSILCNCAFKVAKSDFAAKLDVSTPFILYKSAFVITRYI